MSRIALLLLFLSAPAYGLHVEGHCGKKWVTVQRLGYILGKEYKEDRAQVTLRKSDIEAIFTSSKWWRIVLKGTGVALAYHVSPESGMAVVRCLE